MAGCTYVWGLCRCQTLCVWLCVYVCDDRNSCRDRTAGIQRHINAMRIRASEADRDTEGERLGVDLGSVHVHQEALVRWRAHTQHTHADCRRLQEFFKVSAWAGARVRGCGGARVRG